MVSKLLNPNVEVSECLEEALKNFAIARESLTLARASMKAISQKADAMTKELLQLKNAIDIICTKEDRMIEIFHSNAEIALGKLMGLLVLVKNGKVGKKMAFKLLHLAQNFDSNMLLQLETELVAFATTVSEMKLDLEDKKEHPVTCNKMAFFSCGAFLGAGAMKAFLVKGGVLAIGGKVIVQSGQANREFACVVAAASLVGLVGFALAKLYDRTTNAAVKEHLNVALGHCEDALTVLAQAQDKVKSAATNVKKAENAVQQVEKSAITYCNEDDLDEDTFKEVMEDDLKVTIGIMDRIVVALAPPKEEFPVLSPETVRAAKAVAKAGAVVAAASVAVTGAAALC